MNLKQQRKWLEEERETIHKTLRDLERMMPRHPHSSQKISAAILEATPSVYGILIREKNTLSAQILSFKSIQKAIHHLIPGVHLSEDSYFSYQTEACSFFYLEIKKMKGGIFSPEEKEKLLGSLPSGLEQSVEVAPSLIFSENIEELFKNIGRLSKELKYIDDHPQVMISFIEYSPKALRFLVIMVRILKPNIPSLISLSQRLPSSIQFTLEKSMHMGLVRKKYLKEASYFTLEIQRSLFLGHQDCDLRMVRQYLCKALESMVGPFRDYNGGFLYKEHEQLVAIKQRLEKERFPFFYLLEGVLHRIKPLPMRILISIETGIALAHLFHKQKNSALPKGKKYDVKVEEHPYAAIAILKTEHKEWKNLLPPACLKLCPEIAWSYLEYEDLLYLFFFHQHPDKRVLKSLLLQEIEKLAHGSLMPSGTILKLNFQSRDPPSLNPRLANDIRCHSLHNLLFEGLTRINAQGVSELACAEHIEIDPEHRSYIFHLRTCHWSQGEEVTAYHFEQAWKKALLTPPVFTRPDLFYPIRNVTQARQKKVPLGEVGITARDAKTLVVELESPFPYFLNALSSPIFAPILTDSEEPSQFNGPFAIAEWKQGNYLLLSPNPYYWNASSVHLSGIQIFMIQEAPVFYRMFQEGKLDMIGDPLSPLPLEILQLPEVQNRLALTEISRMFWIHCNTDSPPLHNPHLRYALSLAIDRTRLTKTVFPNYKPCISPLPPKYSSLSPDPSGNPEQARLFFKRALNELQIEPSAFPPLILNHSDLSFEKPLIQELRAQWKEVLGITIHPVELPWNEFSAAFDRGDFQLCGLFRRDLFNHVMSYLAFFKKTDQQLHQWENTEFEACFQRLHEKKSLKKMEKILIEEAPVISLVNQTYIGLMSHRFEGITWDNSGCLNLREARPHENSILSTHSFSADDIVI